MHSSAVNGKLFVKEISEGLLIEYRADFNKLYPSTDTQQKVEERLRSFLKLCHRNGWLIRLPELDAIIQNQVPTLPLNAKQYGTFAERVLTKFSPGEGVIIFAL